MNTLKRPFGRVLMSVLLAGSSFVGIEQAFAATLLVYNNNDSGAGSLRQAVTDNHLLGGNNIIVFSNVVSGNITLTSGELLITNNTSIVGPGEKVLQVQGLNSARVFHFVNALVNVSGLTIANGSNYFGGGIFQEFGTLTLSNCTVMQNKAFNGGGIAQTNGTLILTCCTVSSNSALNTGVGLHLQGNSSSTTLRRCTLAANNGSGFTTAGGGITHNGFALTLDTCTFFFNGGLGNGGGLNNFGNAMITNCTFSANHAFVGGGVAVSGGTVIVRNSILAGNTSITGAGAAPDCFGNIISGGFNLVGNRTNSNGWGSPGDQFGTTASPINPLLGPLQDNGGPTWTIALLNGSPAVDKGHSGATTDQRGASRPYDKPSIANAAGGNGADIGAYETGTRTLIVSNLNSSGAGSLVQATEDAGSEDITTINFAPGLSGTISPANLYLTKNLIINGPGASMLALAGGPGSRVISAFSGTSSISGLTIRDGSQVGEDRESEDDGEDVKGGGIFNQANLSFTDCAILNNSVHGGAAGSTVNGTGGNGGDAFGGGIANYGTLNLTRCILAGNSVFGGDRGEATGSGTPGQGGQGLGAGLYSEGTANLTNCAIYGNYASGGIVTIGGPNAGGGGIFISVGTLNLMTCTVASNSLSSYGEGAGVYDLGGSGVVRNSTIASNFGTGMYVTGTTSVGNTIVAGNMSFTDINGYFVSADYNLFGSTNGSGITGSTAHTIVGQDPLLGALKNNGGLTPTMALLPGSPAIDRGTNFGILTDQRGKARPFDLSGIANAVGGNGTDIGAFEVVSPILYLLRSTTNALLSWSTNDPSYKLEATTNLGPTGVWSLVPGTPAVSGDQFRVADSLRDKKFYRLRSP